MALRPPALTLEDALTRLLQAAGPLGEYAYVGATVGPGFEFADFAFGRDDDAFMSALARLDKPLQRLAGSRR